MAEDKDKAKIIKTQPRTLKAGKTYVKIKQCIFKTT